jgi:hypothetical protein
LRNQLRDENDTRPYKFTDIMNGGWKVVFGGTTTGGSRALLRVQEGDDAELDKDKAYA